MAKQLLIQLKKNGTVEAETLGMYGQECLDYIALLEDLLEADVVDSTYTEAYHRTAIEIAPSNTVDLGLGES